MDSIEEDEYQEFVDNLSPEEKKMLQEDKNFYQITFENKGGLPMPVIVQFTYADGTDEVIRIPAEIWRMGNTEITKIFPTEKEVVQFTLDPYQEIADTDTSNNHYPPKASSPSRFDMFKRKTDSRRGSSSNENPMQRAIRAKKVIRP